MFLRARFVLVAWVLLVVSVSCQGGVERDADPAPSGPASLASGAAPALSPPVDVSAIIRQVHFAFRPEGDELVGGHETYGVNASASGFTVRPRHAAHPDIAGLTLTTTAVQRGAAVASNAPPTARVARDGSLVVDRGGVREQLTNGDDGVEQSWAFDQRPPGQGDVLVRVHASGMPYRGRTELGLHFADPESHLGLRYGRAVWVDASARRTDIATTLEGDDIVLRVPAAVLDDSAYPATLDPLLSPEIDMDNLVYAAATRAQTSPALASDGNDYLVVWSDPRGLNSTPDIVGARVSGAGALLDPGGILVTSAAGYENAPAVSFDGVNYLVVWGETPGAASQEDIRGARLTPAGALLDPGGFPISTAPLQQRSPAITFNGSEYLVVWEDARAAGPWDIYGARVTPGAVVLDPSGIILSNAPADQLRPRLSSNGDSFLVVWTDKRLAANSGVYGARVGADGVVADPLGIAIAPGSGGLHQMPSIAFSGSNYLVAWCDSGGMKGQRLDPVTAQPIDATPFVISTNGFIYYDSVTVYAAGIDRYFVAASNPLSNASITGTWVNPTTGAVYATSFQTYLSTASAAAGVAAGASNGTSYLFAWQTNGAIQGRRIAAPQVGTSSSWFPIGLAPDDETLPAVDFDGTRWLVSWTRNWFTTSDIVAVRLDAQGQVLDPAGIVVSAATAKQTNVRIAHDAQSFFLVWQDDRSASSTDIYGARINAATGAVVDPSGLPISTATGTQSNPDVAFDGTNFLVVWEDHRSGTDIYGARVPAATGVPIEPAGIPIAKGVVAHETPTIAFDGAHYLVVWTNRAGSGANQTNDIFGARVHPSGLVLDPVGFVISGSLAQEMWPRLAFGNQTYFVVWSDSRTSAKYAIYGARIDPSGAVLDPAGIAVGTSADNLYNPAVAFDGYDFVAGWWNNTDKQTYASWVRPDGVVLGPSNLVVGPGSSNAGPSLAADGAGHTLAAYSRYEVAPPYGARRAFARVMSLGADLGAACSLATGCISGQCVDGVCCNTACGNATSDCQACSVAAGAAVDGTCGPVLAGTVCRAKAGVCDVDDACDGAQLACPPNAFAPIGTECRAANGQCNPAEVCSGQSALCPIDGKLPDGAACDDGDICSSSDHCAAGACVSAPVLCVAPDQCHAAGLCDPQSGQCIPVAVPDGTSCNDGNACTQLDVCTSGACSGGAPVVCPAPDQCHSAATCNPQTGACSNPAKADGAACDDGDACSQIDACKAGACVGANPLSCAAQDECHAAGQCDSTSGVCTNPVKPDGAACGGGACLAGECVAVPATTGSSSGSSASSASSGSSASSATSGGGGATGTGGASGTTGGAGGVGATASGTGGAGEASATSAGGAGTGGAGSVEGETSGGCGCGVAGSPQTGGLWLALGLVLARRRRASKRAS
jgi:hypothetical protein